VTPTDPSDGITLKDVIVHLQHMEVRLSKRMDTLETEIGGLKGNMIGFRTSLTHRLDTLEDRLTQRMNALEEDLTETMRGMLVIRRHVGMPVEEE
jgi:hypothetical protein